MIDVRKRFGHLMNIPLKFKYHRVNSSKYAYCRNNLEICVCRMLEFYNYKDLCKNCLKTSTPEEIDEIKYYFIKKKLGIK